MSGHLFASLLRRAATDPGATFCTIARGSQDTLVTVGQLVRSAAGIGSALRAAAVPKGAVVLIVLEHGEHLYSSFVGTVLFGAVPSFMPPLTRKQDPKVYQSSLEALIARIEPAAIVTSLKAAPSLPDTVASRIFVDSLREADKEIVERQTATAAQLDSFATAFLQHSSGTTGLKKGVMLSHGAVLEQVRSYSRAIGLEAGDTIISWLPLYHDMGLIACFLLPAIIGAPLVSLDALEWVMRPTTLLQRISDHQGRFVWLPNFAFLHIMRLDSGRNVWDLSSLKAVINCSEPSRAATFRAFLARYSSAGITPERMQVSYALAENVFAATHTPAGLPSRVGNGQHTRGFVSSGVPIEGATIQMRSPDGAFAKPGDVGEIWLKAPYLFNGYFRQPELTSSKLVNGWYRTGDLGVMEDGELFVIGRLDDRLIVNGRNIMAHEIEDDLNNIEGLIPGRSLVCGRFDDELGTTELIVIAERDDSGRETADIEVAVRNTVNSSAGVLPAEVAFVEAGFLLKSTSGKLARAASYAKFIEKDAQCD